MEIIEVPSRHTEIMDHAFDGCNTDMVIKAPNPSKARAFALEHGFGYCHNLVQVYIPASVKSADDIAPDAFANCGQVYLFGVSGGAAQDYCALSEHAGFMFVPVEE
ncbi:MAG: hypothetical protein J6A79_14940 [Clostridia bacterium]|nr:hypothetical protein [Clostridia bacterium]